MKLPKQPTSIAISEVGEKIGGGLPQSERGVWDRSDKLLYGCIIQDTCKDSHTIGSGW